MRGVDLLNPGIPRIMVSSGFPLLGTIDSGVEKHGGWGENNGDASVLSAVRLVVDVREVSSTTEIKLIN